MSAPLEIEYKYLICFPDTSIMEQQPSYNRQEMTQLYLELPAGMDENGTRCRIRSVTDTSGTKYIKTFKTSVSDMTRIEIESEISKEDFLELSLYVRKGFSPIKKIRHSFSLFGFTYEVDIFPFWNDRAYLEIEVENENTCPPIPDFISIIKDVTADKKYRNTFLAQLIFNGNIDSI